MGQFFKNTNLHVNTINCLSSTITIVYHRYTNLLAVFFHKWKSSEKIGKQMLLTYISRYLFINELPNEMQAITLLSLLCDNYL